jgi:hypothetical protein
MSLLLEVVAHMVGLHKVLRYRFSIFETSTQAFFSNSVTYAMRLDAIDEKVLSDQ